MSGKFKVSTPEATRILAGWAGSFVEQEIDVRVIDREPAECEQRFELTEPNGDCIRLSSDALTKFAALGCAFSLTLSPDKRTVFVTVRPPDAEEAGFLRRAFNERRHAIDKRLPPMWLCVALLVLASIVMLHDGAALMEHGKHSHDITGTAMDAALDWVFFWHKRAMEKIPSEL